jgi:hypothetical protein
MFGAEQVARVLIKFLGGQGIGFPECFRILRIFFFVGFALWNFVATK